MDLLHFSFPDLDPFLGMDPYIDAESKLSAKIIDNSHKKEKKIVSGSVTK